MLEPRRRFASDEPLGTLFGRLLADGQRVARAEIDLRVAMAKAKVADVRTPAILFVVAAILATSAVTAFLVGAVMQLSHLVGHFFAGLIVLLVCFAIAAVLAKVGAAKLGGSR